MKKLLFIMLLSFSLISCTRTIQIEYLDGKRENIQDLKGISPKLGDTVIIRSYFAGNSYYHDVEIYGMYKGVLPKADLGNGYSFFYDKAVVIKYD